MKSRILYLQYTNPAAYPPLEHSARILANAGWQVLFLGAHVRGVESLHFRPHERIRVRLMPFRPSGTRQKVHYLLFAIWVLAYTLGWRPTWVYVSDSLACPIGAMLSFLPGVRVAYHEHDAPVGGANRLFMRLCLAAREFLALRCALRILPNRRRAERFVDDLGTKNVYCVWNCPTRDEVGPVREPVAAHSLKLVYHGSVSPAQLPGTVLDAVARLAGRVTLSVTGYETVGHIGYTRELQARATRLEIAERVTFAPAMPRHKLLERARYGDVGLALVPKNSKNVNYQGMVGASNKAFDYLASGMPVLVVNQPDWAQAYVETGYGLMCDPESGESIAAALGWFLEHPRELRAMGEGGRQRILSDWNYERQFGPVLEQMRTLSSTSD
jgi:glycosyltransferase involved in cell wall biosynthesis